MFKALSISSSPCFLPHHVSKFHPANFILSAALGWNLWFIAGSTVNRSSYLNEKFNHWKHLQCLIELTVDRRWDTVVSSVKVWHLLCQILLDEPVKLWTMFNNNYKHFMRVHDVMQALVSCTCLDTLHTNPQPQPPHSYFPLPHEGYSTSFTEH